MKKLVLFICLGLSVSTQAMLRVGARRVLPAAVRSLSTKPCTKETVQEDMAEIETKIKKTGEWVEAFTRATALQSSMVCAGEILSHNPDLLTFCTIFYVAPFAAGAAVSSGNYLRYQYQLKRLQKKYNHLNEE